MHRMVGGFYVFCYHWTMNDVIPSVGVIVFQGSNVLLVQKRNHPRQAYQLPGGQIEQGESVKEAALRELLETTGLKGDPTQVTVLPDEWSARIEKTYGVKIFSFKCVICKVYTGGIHENESAIPVWVEQSKLGELNLVPNTLMAIEAAARTLGAT